MNTFSAVNPVGCLMSEKYDGIWAEWNGETLTSRDGNTFAAPDWFLASLPKCKLRGELWAGRGQFEVAMSIVKSNDSGDRWRQIKFMVFDGELGLELGEFSQYVPRWPVESQAHINEEMSRIVSQGGEGVVVRDANGNDYKHKPVSDDDAIVVDHAKGTGRNSTRLGALVVRDRAGRTFKIGTGLSDELREDPPARGAIVTFAYQGRTRNGVPRFASFRSIRAELRFV